MIKKLSTQSLKVLYNTLKMGLMLDFKGELDGDIIKFDIEILESELGKRGEL